MLTPASERRTDVLLIDDSLTDLRLLMSLMTSRRMRVSVAFEGIKGYRQAELLQPGLILLDVRMPGMDGFATCRLLKENPKTRFIPVIFLSAATELEERLEGFAVGGVDYICKPFNEQEVLARVGVHLELVPRATLEADIPEENSALESPSFDAVLVASGQKILRQSLTEPPTLPGLAQKLGTNRRRLNEAFQAQCGLPVFAWLREERLRQAHSLLASTDMQVTEISDFVGYSTPANFAKAFRERFGCTPSVLRQELRRSKKNDSSTGS